METASVRLTVVSGHTVVHRASTNAMTTAWPRNCRSETRDPFWSVSVKSGAAEAGRLVPGSTSGFRSAALPRAWLATGVAVRPPDTETITPTTAAAAIRDSTTATMRAAGRRGGRAPGGPAACSSSAGTALTLLRPVVKKADGLPQDLPRRDDALHLAAPAVPRARRWVWLPS